MSELSPEAKNLLGLARETFADDAARLERARAALAQRIAATAGPGATATGEPTASGSGGAAAGLPWGALHLVAFGMVIAALSVGAVIALRLTPAVPAAGPSVVVQRSEASMAPDPGATTRDPAPAARVAARVAVPEPSRAEARVRGARTPRAVAGQGRARRDPTGDRARAVPGEVGPAREPTEAITEAPRDPNLPAADSSPPPVEPIGRVQAPEPRQAAEDGTFARELVLVRKARAALDHRNAARSLALLDEHAAAYPRGTLRQERLALRVLSLCALGRTAEARAAHAELQRTAPRSPHLMRIRSSCIAERE